MKNVITFALALAVLCGLIFWDQSHAAQTLLCGSFPGDTTADSIQGACNKTQSNFTNLFAGAQHLNTSGASPTLSSCGSGTPTITGTDTAGVVTLGTSATACTITFATAYSSAPACNVTWQSNLASMSYTLSKTAITLGQTSTSGNLINYECFGNPS